MFSYPSCTITFGIQFGIIISIWDDCSFSMQMQSEQIIILATSGLETQSYMEID